MLELDVHIQLMSGQPEHFDEYPGDLSMVGVSPKIAVEAIGSGSLVLFLHGVGADRRMWRSQLTAIGERYRAVAWDARGYGRSEGRAQPFRLEDAAADVVRVVQGLGHERAHLVGQSMGGLIVQLVLADYPALAASATLVNTTPSVGAALSPEQVAAFMAARREPIERGVPMSDIAPTIAPALIGPDAPPNVLEELVAMMSDLDADHYLGSLAAAIDYQPKLRLGEVRTPTLVVTGEHDRTTPPSAAEHLAQTIPGARYYCIPEAGHMSNMERPQAFNARLLAFLDEQERVTRQ